MAETLKLGKAPKLLDLEVIDKGVRKEAPDAPGVFFRILPWANYNPRFKEALQKHAGRDVDSGRLKGGGNIQEIARKYELSRQEDPEFLVDAILPDSEDAIEGVLDENDEPVKYTRKRGVQILSDRQMQNVRDWLVHESILAARIRADEVQHSGNGSRPASRGKKSGAARSKKTGS